MEKQKTDRIVNLWVVAVILGPVSVISMAAYWVGYVSPNAVDSVRDIAQLFGLHEFAVSRSRGLEHEAAAYLFWFICAVTLPLDISWLHFVGMKLKLVPTLRAIAVSNLRLGRWDPRKFTATGGHLRFLLVAILMAALLLVQLISQREPSYCSGCETSSPLGFLLINWVGTHLLMIATYIAISYLVLWRSILNHLGEKNE